MLIESALLSRVQADEQEVYALEISGRINRTEDRAALLFLARPEHLDLLVQLITEARGAPADAR